MKIRVASLTDMGLVRQNNEDDLLVCPHIGDRGVKETDRIIEPGGNDNVTVIRVDVVAMKRGVHPFLRIRMPYDAASELAGFTPIDTHQNALRRNFRVGGIYSH